MPEGPEVLGTQKSLKLHLQSKYLIDLCIYSTSRHASKGIEGMQYLKRGLYLQDILVKGKRIIFDLVNIYTNQHIFLLSFLGMEGHWVKEKTKHTSISICFGDIDLNSRLFSPKNVKTFYFDDSRHFGFIKIFPDQKELDNALKNVGPDLLNEEVSYDTYYATIKKPILTNKQICWFLLEQKYFSGIGNYLKSEILYSSRIAPYRIIGTLTDQEIYNLYCFSLNIIREAADKNGLTIATYIDPDGVKGTFETKVYNKKIDPYGYNVTKETFTDKRMTHWVPGVQV